MKQQCIWMKFNTHIKPYKLILMKSIHEIDIYILENPKTQRCIHDEPKLIEISFYKHMKLKYLWIESNTYCKL